MKTHICLLLLCCTHLTQNGALDSATQVLKHVQRSKQENSKEPIKGDIYIVPSKPHTRNKELEKSRYFKQKAIRLLSIFTWYRRRFQSPLIDQTEKALGRQIADDEILVHVCATSQDSKNWHEKHPAFNVQEGKQFPLFLPYKLLEELQEGDVLEVTVHGQPVHLCCLQEQHQYARNRVSGGTIPFQDRLAQLKKQWQDAQGK